MKQIFAIMRYADRLVRHTRANGLRSSAALVGKNLIWPYSKWLSQRRIREHEQFDTKYRIDTQMPVPLSDLEASAPGARFANRYEGTPIAAFHKIIRRLKIDRARFTFIDLGSGKGRVLLIAAQYPFKSIIGVEFSEKLHKIALDNIHRFVNSGATQIDINSVNCDAGEFDFSEIADKIIFCYNPFGAAVMNQVLDNLQSPACQKGQTILLYLGPMPDPISETLISFPVIDKGEFLSEFGFYEQYSIYKIR